MEALTANNVPEYFTALSRIISVAKSNYSGEKILFFYRGHSNENWDLAPGVLRDKSHALNERKYIDELTRNFPDEFKNRDSEFDNLVKCQHYELPTRLLDVTSNAMTALFFAVRDIDETCDACVYIFPVNKSNIKRPSEDIDKLIEELTSSKSDKHVKTINFNNIDCIAPRLNNPRIIRQQGAFFLFKDAYKIGEVIAPTADYKIIIPKEKKKDIQEELENYGVNEMFFFPELTTAANYLKAKAASGTEEEPLVPPLF